MSQLWVSVEKEHLGLSVWRLGANVGDFLFQMHSECFKGKTYASRKLTSTVKRILYIQSYHSSYLMTITCRLLLFLKETV